MNLHKTSCCAIADISELNTHQTPKAAMISFCQQAILKPPMFGRAAGNRDQIYSFYLFTAAVYPKGKYTGYGRSYSPYGKEFCDFIRDNNLGEVWESPARPNKAYHPDRENQVYVWIPDHAAIKAWWAENDPDKVVPIEAATVVKKRKRRTKVEVPVEPERVEVNIELNEDVGCCPF